MKISIYNKLLFFNVASSHRCTRMLSVPAIKGRVSGHLTLTICPKSLFHAEDQVLVLWPQLNWEQEWSYELLTFCTFKYNNGKKKNRTVTSFAHKSFENSPSVLKFLLKLLFSIIKHHWKNQWPALNSLRIIDFLKVLVRWSEIQSAHIRIYKKRINKL